MCFTPWSHETSLDIFVRERNAPAQNYKTKKKARKIDDYVQQNTTWNSKTSFKNLKQTEQ